MSNVEAVHYDSDDACKEVKMKMAIENMISDIANISIKNSSIIDEISTNHTTDTTSTAFISDIPKESSTATQKQREAYRAYELEGGNYVDVQDSEESGETKLIEQDGLKVMSRVKQHLKLHRPTAPPPLLREIHFLKKLNQDLKRQVQELQREDAVAMLLNQLKDKQYQMDTLVRENKNIKNQHRYLIKQIELLQDVKNTLPQKLRLLENNKRTWKHKIKKLKAREKELEELNAKVHKAFVDLTVKNNVLQEKIKQNESQKEYVVLSPRHRYTPLSFGQRTPRLEHVPTSEDIITLQENEITRLRNSIALSNLKYKNLRMLNESNIKSCEKELASTREDLQNFHTLLFSKEKTIRSQFLHIKKLKAALKTLLKSYQASENLELQRRAPNKCDCSSSVLIFSSSERISYRDHIVQQLQNLYENVVQIKSNVV